MAEKRKNGYWKETVIVTDTGWGDSGKGKVVDYGAQFAQVVVRYSGGDNAGHTIRNDKGEFKLHLLPSGIFNPDALCVMTAGVVINPQTLIEEIEDVSKKRVQLTQKNLAISSSAHMILPWHKERDGLQEAARKGKKIGTTGRGIGPVYADFAERTGLRIGDLLSKDLKKRFDEENAFQEKLLSFLNGGKLPDNHYDATLVYKKLLEARDMIGPMVTDTLKILWQQKEKGKSILGEGAQGALLDLTLGGYPYVTSSHPGLSGFSISTGIYDVQKVIGVTKAYTTRVGSGPMPTELTDKTGEYIREKGHEFGATTGRPRRCGWFDGPAMRFGARITGVTTGALTKMDILDGLKEIKICIAYEIDGKKYKEITSAEILEKAKPVYETLPGWESDTTGVRSFEKLPANAKKYIKKLEAVTGIPYSFISVGPERDATMLTS